MPEQSSTPISTALYFAEMSLTFPPIQAALKEEESGMVHYKMERFADYTIAQLKSNHRAEWKKCFDFQEQRIPLLNEELFNALNVSYCESILLSEALEEMPSIVQDMGILLQRIYRDYEKYYNDLSQ